MAAVTSVCQHVALGATTLATDWTCPSPNGWRASKVADAGRQHPFCSVCLAKTCIPGQQHPLRNVRLANTCTAAGSGQLADLVILPASLPTILQHVPTAHDIASVHDHGRGLQSLARPIGHLGSIPNKEDVLHLELIKNCQLKAWERQQHTPVWTCITT